MMFAPEKWKLLMILLALLTLYLFLIFRMKYRLRSYYLPNDRSKLTYLLYLRDHFPALFQRAPRYGRDLFEVLDYQVKIFKKIRKLSKLYRHSPFRRDEGFLTIEAKYRGSYFLDERINSWERYPLLLSTLESDLEEFNKRIGSTVEKSALHWIKDLTFELTSSPLWRPERFWQSYMEVRAFPSLMREEFSLLPATEKIKQLANFLDQHKILDYPLQLKWPELNCRKLAIGGQWTGKQLLDSITKCENIRKDLGTLLQITGLLSDEELECLQDFSIQRKWQKKHSQNDLKVKRVLGKMIDQFKEHLEKSPREEKDTFNQLIQESRSILKGQALKASKNKQDHGVRILKFFEVPPFVGIFRGHVGRDCSTQYSFPYPNSPMEKVFFITGQSYFVQKEEEQNLKDEIKGYVSGTLVEVFKKKMFYLHTIAGQKFSAADITAIIESFYLQRKVLGVEDIVLPDMAQISSLISDAKIRSYFERPLQRNGEQGKAIEKVEIQYLDKEIRERIDEYVVAKYDCAASNTSGYLYSHLYSKEEVKLLAMKVGSIDYPPFEYKKKIDMADVIRLILDLKHMERMDTIKRVLQVSKISVEDFDDLLSEMNNPQRLEIKAYFARLEWIFSRFKIDFKRDLLVKKRCYFAKGLLRAADAMEDNNRKDTIKNLIKMLKRRKIDGIKEVSKFLIRNKEALNQDPFFLKFVEELIVEKGDKRESKDFWKFLYLYNLQVLSKENIDGILKILLRDEQLNSVKEEFSLHKKIGIKGQTIFRILEQTHPLSAYHVERIEKLVKLLIEQGDPLAIRQLVIKITPALKIPQIQKLFEHILNTTNVVAVCTL